VAVQVNRLRSSLYQLTKLSILLVNSLTLVDEPRRIALSVMIAKKRSIWLSRLEYVGTKSTCQCGRWLPATPRPTTTSRKRLPESGVVRRCVAAGRQSKGLFKAPTLTTSRGVPTPKKTDHPQPLGPRIEMRPTVVRSSRQHCAGHEWAIKQNANLVVGVCYGVRPRISSLFYGCEGRI
jgi:hypothetical protein